MNKTTKIILGIIVAIVAIGGIWYGVSRKPVPKTSTSTTAKEPIKIGYVAVLSGPAASWGIYGKDAAEMAVDEINKENNNVKLKIIWGDSAAKPKQGVTEFRKLNEVNQPDVFIIDASGVASAVAPLANQYKKPIIFGAVALQDITKDSKYLFRNFYLCEESAPLLARKAYEMGISKVAVLSANESYAQSCNKLFQRDFKKLGGSIVADEKFPMSEMDFKTQLTKIKGTDAQAVYTIGYEKWLLEITKEMKELGIDKTILAEMVLYAPVIREKVLNLTNPPKVYLTANKFYLGDEKAEGFAKKFEEKYGKKPPYLAGYIYDTVYLIEKAARIAKEKGISLREALKEVKIKGVNGMLGFDKDRETHTKMNFVELTKDGTLILK